MSGKEAEYQLTYFDLCGLGEPVRMMLIFGNRNWSERRVSFAEWPTLKTSPEFPYHQMPILKVGDKTLAQSKALARYVAQESGLYYSDIVTAAVAESIIEAIADLSNVAAFGRTAFGSKSDAEKAAEFAEKIAALPGQIAPIVKLFQGKFFRGDAPSFVDIYFFGWVRTQEEFSKTKFGSTLAGFADTYNALAADERVKAYDASRASAASS